MIDELAGEHGAIASLSNMKVLMKIKGESIILHSKLARGELTSLNLGCLNQTRLLAKSKPLGGRGPFLSLLPKLSNN